MKKTISITINNAVFQINEDAYNVLEEYLNSINKHYGKSKEGQEILTDIEASIAEKFSSKTNSRKKFINIKDVEEIISLMGTVEEFSQDDEGKDGFASEPEERSELRRSIYRDPDNQIIAGVCSGIAAYFDVDPVYIRLVFVALLFINGIGFLLYIILWIVIPEAKTNIQKLEMRGKDINLEKIEQVVKEKAQQVKEEGQQALTRLKGKQGTLNKILYFPIKLAEDIFSFIGKFFKALVPTISIIIGVCLGFGILISILALSVAVAVLMFNVDLSYFVSDVELVKFVGSYTYYIGLASAYIVVLVPLLFVLTLGFMMIRRKNMFAGLASSVLLSIWFLAIVTLSVAVIDMAPVIKEEVVRINQEELVEKNYDFKDFNKLYIGANINAEIIQGDDFSISMTGRGSDLNRLDFAMEEGQLQIHQNDRDTAGKFCVFCFDKDIEAKIVMPQLDSYVGVKNTRADISGFSDNIYVSLGESSRASILLSGQEFECQLHGIDSRLELSGDASVLDCALDGSARLTTDDLQADKIYIKQDIFSRVNLDGSTNLLQVETDGNARLNAYNIEAQEINLDTHSFSRAKIYNLGNVKIKAHDNSRVTFVGNTEDNVEMLELGGSIEPLDEDS